MTRPRGSVPDTADGVVAIPFDIDPRALLADRFGQELQRAAQHFTAFTLKPDYVEPVHFGGGIEPGGQVDVAVGA